MKTQFCSRRSDVGGISISVLFAAAFVSAAALAWPAPPGGMASAGPAAIRSAPIPMDQLGAVAGNQYHGDGLSVTATPDGARLRCVFQRLEGHATAEGLWLDSTAAGGGKFRLTAKVVGREVLECGSPLPLSHAPVTTQSGRGLPHSKTLSRSRPALSTSGDGALSHTGTISVADNLVRFIRPGLTEEYSVSMDGVRQDFVIGQRPAGEGPLRVELDVTGAKAEPLVNGARLVLDGSGRKLAYHRLRAVDARGKEVAGQIEVLAAHRLAVVVDDAAAEYPVRIDPTFSDANWISFGGVAWGADSTVSAMVSDGVGNVYIGGGFTVVGDVIANGVAKWDGTAWSALGAGMGGVNPGVSALAVSGTNLYAGGSFTTAGEVSANHIAKWDGNSWSALGSGISGPSGAPYYGGRVSALAVSGTNLYAGGSFTTAGDVSANNIAKWDGSAWSVLGVGLGAGEYAMVSALAVSGSTVYAGGFFTTAGGVSATNIAKWNGGAWSALGSGIGGSVSALAVSGSVLYAGGDFTKAGGVSANHIAKWNGSAWSALGSGISGQVVALAMSGTNLYAGGYFGTAGEVSANYIAKWNGSAWTALGAGMNSSVNALAVSGTNLYAGGQFSRVEGASANHIARWDGSAWTPVASGSGMDDRVSALAVSGSVLYVGGAFTTAGGASANSIAKWDGSAWSALGSGMNSYVYALAVAGTNLYAGGLFTAAGEVPANYIAKWNGNSWSALGSGISGPSGDPYYGGDVHALAVSGSVLYVGGDFTTAGGVSATNIAKWNGSSWSALGSGISGVPPSYPSYGSRVLALAASGSVLYAGGAFTNAGGVRVSNIAKWNGSSWSALGSGISGPPGDPSRSFYGGRVEALAVSGSVLYAGGTFTNAGGVAANYIAKWNGSSWSTLGAGISLDLPYEPHVYALAVSGTNLYAAGRFTTAGGMSANNIAKWDGNAWSPLGSGMGGGPYHPVSTLAVSGSVLHAGGYFTTAGDQASAYLARAIIGTVGGRFGSPAYSPATGFSLTFSDATPGEPYRIQSSPSLAEGSWTDFTNFTYSGPLVITDNSVSLTTNKCFRAVTP